MAKYSKKAGEKVETTMKEMKKGSLRSGNGQKVTNPKQAIAIGLSEAREEGAKVPKKGGAKKPATSKPGPQKSAAKKTAPKKSAPKKAAAKSRSRQIGSKESRT